MEQKFFQKVKNESRLASWQSFREIRLFNNRNRMPNPAIQMKTYLSPSITKFQLACYWSLSVSRTSGLWEVDDNFYFNSKSEQKLIFSPTPIPDLSSSCPLPRKPKSFELITKYITRCKLFNRNTYLLQFSLYFTELIMGSCFPSLPLQSGLWAEAAAKSTLLQEDFQLQSRSLNALPEVIITYSLQLQLDNSWRKSCPPCSAQAGSARVSYPASHPGGSWRLQGGKLHNFFEQPLPVLSHPVKMCLLMFRGNLWTPPVLQCVPIASWTQFYNQNHLNNTFCST